VRGFDRFFSLANALLRDRADVICVAVGDPIVRRGLDVVFHNRDYPAHLMAEQPVYDRERFWLLGHSKPAVVAEVLAASDLHVAPSRPYPVARSLLEALACGCVVLASDIEPHRDVLSTGRNALLVAEKDQLGLLHRALDVLTDPVEYQPLGDAGAQLVLEQYSQDVCLPRLAEKFAALALSGRAFS
jgi:glycosyltransferase involved in cell wall biosynthesis